MHIDQITKNNFLNSLVYKTVKYIYINIRVCSKFYCGEKILENVFSHTYLELVIPGSTLCNNGETPMSMTSEFKKFWNNCFLM